MYISVWHFSKLDYLVQMGKGEFFDAGSVSVGFSTYVSQFSINFHICTVEISVHIKGISAQNFAGI